MDDPCGMTVAVRTVKKEKQIEKKMKKKKSKQKFEENLRGKRINSIYSFIYELNYTIISYL